MTTPRERVEKTNRVMSRERFQELMGDAVIALPQDLKSVLRIVDDPEVDDESRVRLAGALLHVISEGTSIPGVRGVLQRVGTVLVIRLALEEARGRSPAALARHLDAAPELLEPLDEQLEVARAFIGDGMTVLAQVVEKLPSLSHQGHTARECVHDVEHSNWLYDTVHVALVESMEIDEDDVSREIKGAQQIPRALEARLR
jgi:hypothetical protein